MGRIWTVTVNPDITPAELKVVWEDAIEFAETSPGVTAAILFAPGLYPLPDPGAYQYKTIPTPLHVGFPGTEVRFTYRNHRLHVASYPIGIGESA
jgi:hypothetical protein